MNLTKSLEAPIEKQEIYPNDPRFIDIAKRYTIDLSNLYLCFCKSYKYRRRHFPVPTRPFIETKWVLASEDCEKKITKTMLGGFVPFSQFQDIDFKEMHIKSMFKTKSFIAITSLQYNQRIHEVFNVQARSLNRVVSVMHEKYKRTGNDRLFIAPMTDYCDLVSEGRRIINHQDFHQIADDCRDFFEDVSARTLLASKNNPESFDFYLRMSPKPVTPNELIPHSQKSVDEHRQERERNRKEWEAKLAEIKKKFGGV